MHPLPPSAHVAAATLNQTVGDWTGNRRRIRAALDGAREVGAQLLVLPEMCVSGYSLGDRLMMRGTLERSWESLMALLPATHGLVALIGLPLRHRDVLYNVVAVCCDGDLVGIVPKENLAAGDVQYENRWFSGWQRGRVETLDSDTHPVPMGTLLFEHPALGRFAVEVCEDGWLGDRPGSSYALAGARIVANPSASWFTLGKHAVRRQMVEQISREDKVTYVYTSLLGCDATRLVFDGSVFIAHDGELLAEGRRFLFDADSELIHQVVDLAQLERNRLEEGSWRQQAATRWDHVESPAVVQLDAGLPECAPAAAPAPYWRRGTETGPTDPSLGWLFERGLIPRIPTPADLPHLELELALTLSLREYQGKCRIPGFALALSGGRDSAMCAMLVWRMFRYDQPELDGARLTEHISERFITAYLATDLSGSATEAAAAAVAEATCATHLRGAIQPAVDTHLAIFEQMTGTSLTWEQPGHDIPLQNVQARLRGSLIWMVANLKGFLLIATSNKSEAAVGYTTMDGDTSGGISPISDVPKSLVQEWLVWAADFHGLDALTLVNRTPATAELRPADRAQTDEGDLMPYEVLDRLMYQFVQRGQDPVHIFRTLWPELSARYGGDAAAFAADIRLFIRKFCASQWKRERFAIGFRVAEFDLDPKTGFRFPPVQAPFTEELAALDAWVAQLEEP